MVEVKNFSRLIINPIKVEKNYKKKKEETWELLGNNPVFKRSKDNVSEESLSVLFK
jgi:HSP90 family molecular chaperone